MTNTKLISVLLVLLLSACAQSPSLGESNPQPKPLPEAVTNPPAASTQGSLTKNLEDGLNESLRDLAEALSKLRKSQQPIVPAEHSF